MFKVIIVLAVLQSTFAQNTIPATGENGQIGGIFGPGGGLLGSLLSGGSSSGSSSSGTPSSSSSSGGLSAMFGKLAKDVPLSSLNGLASAFGGAGKEGDTGNKLTPEQMNNTGTGKYPAAYMVDLSLVDKTIYAPKAPPSDLKMPVIVWGQGGCFKAGTLHQAFLLELASHGYLVLANGYPSGGHLNTIGDVMKLSSLPQTHIKDMFDSIDWVKSGKAAKYGNIDVEKIAAAGQSCGGCEALSASYHNDNIKLTILVDSGSLNGNNRNLLKEFKYPVGIFNGGPKDIASKNGDLDYEAFPPRIGAVNANLDAGHDGTLFMMNGGKFGQAVSTFLEWQFRGDAKAKARFLDRNSANYFGKDNWNISAKGW